MSLIEKINLLNLSEKEEEKIKEKFFVSLSDNFVSYEDLENKITFLNEKGIMITKGIETRIFTLSMEEIAKNVNLLEEIGEVDLYRDDPRALSYNVIDIYKRIKYCVQNNIEYKHQDESGNYVYESFLKYENLWQKEILKLKNTNVSHENEEPTFLKEDNAIEEGKLISNELESIISDEASSNDEENLDRFSFSDEFLNNVYENKELDSAIEEKETENKGFSEVPDLSVDLTDYVDRSEAQTTNFAEIQNNEITENSNPLDEWEKSIGDQLNKLDEVKSELGFYDLDFNDLEPETYGRGGRSA